MKTLHTLIASASLLTVSACASIIEGSTDSVHVSTAPVSNANCTLTNTRGTYSTFTPAPATVKKSINDLDISCADPRTGATGSAKLVSEIEPWDFGNILFGGLIGMGVDWGTGAAYNYPDNVTVPMNVPVAQVPVLENFADPSATAPTVTAPAAPQPTILPATNPYYTPPVQR